MYNDRSIYILGFGAIGKALGVHLALSGRQVVIVRATGQSDPDAMTRVRMHGTDNNMLEAHLRVTSLTGLSELDGLVVLANKSFGNAQLAEKLRNKIGDSPIVLLQNGLGVEEPFMTEFFREIYRCVLFVTAQNISENEVRFKPVTTCPVGIEKGRREALAEVVKQLDTPGFRFVPHDDIKTVVWRKAIVNSVFNSICPLLEVDNGIFHRNDAALAIARSVIAECAAVARAEGVMIEEREAEEMLLQISRSSDGQLISTYQDILAGRPTEIETLNLQIAKCASRADPALPVVRTGLLGELIRLKEEVKMRQ